MKFLFACVLLAFAQANQCDSVNKCPDDQCCSYWGYCGKGDDYCLKENGCKSNCLSPAQECSAEKPCDDGKCCSKDGFCGSMASECSKAFGCQANCWEGATSPNVDITAMKCSKNFPCHTGQCCSAGGFCGSTAEHCAPSKSCISNCWSNDSGPSYKHNLPECSLYSSREPPAVTTEIITKCDVPNSFVFTYDDGPGIVTGEILDLLKSLEMHVTFFVVGQNVESRPDLVKRAYDEGHIIASHSYSHANLSTLSEDGIRSEMQKASDAIYKVIGVRPKYMRPPYGECSSFVAEVLQSMGYRIVNWNLDALDWQLHNDGKTADDLVDAFVSMLNSAGSEGIISLTHDTYQITLDAQQREIDAVLAKGRRLTTLQECFNDKSPYQ